MIFLLTADITATFSTFFNLCPLCKRPPAFLKISHARFCLIRPWLGAISALSLPLPFCPLSSTLLYSQLSLPTLRLTLFLAHYKYGPQTCHPQFRSLSHLQLIVEFYPLRLRQLSGYGPAIKM